MAVARRWQKILGFGVLAALVAAWLFISWFRWPDCLVDFGRELYIPWQITQGKILYRDLYFYYGPLAKYFHAFLFKCFGPSLVVIIITNFIFLLVTAYAIHLLFKSLRGFWAGIVAVYLFLGIFAFGRYTETANYNFICPYSHELVYGFGLSLIGLLVTAYWLKHPKTVYLGCIGLLTGLIFLTKIEIFAAFFASVTAAFLLDSFHKRISIVSFIKKSAVLFFFALIAPGVFLLFMYHQASFHEAVNAFFEPFVMTKYLGLDKANMIFYKNISGFDNPHGNFLLAFKSAIGYVVVALVLGIFSYLISRFKSKRVRFFLILLLGIVDVLVCAHMKIGSFWAILFRGVPLILVVVILIKCYQFFKGSSKDKDLSNSIFWIAFSMYALMLLSKILLFVTPFQYGFVLAVPGTLILAVILTNDFACWGRGKFYYPKVYRALAIGFLLGVLIVHFRWSRNFYEHINYPVSQGQDQFFSLDRDILSVGYKSVLINSILQWINKNTSPKDTLVVMPEGVMINYLSRRQDPLPISEFEPSIVNLFGEDRIIDSLKRTLPSYIILIHRDMLEHGAQTFGIDYGKRIYQWIWQNYENKFIWGEQPSQENNNSRVPQAFLMRRIN